MKRVLAFKGFLWFLVGGAAAMALFRFWRGLGATTALTDLTPWGFWIGFDVMGGVALAAGGFVIAATVYVFHLDRYHPIVRPAVLTAFLGYIAVIIGLLFDLGLPWHIFNMIVFWNPHSPLFEVGWCVMLYTTVLALEFAPVVLEAGRNPLLQKAYRILKKATIPLVIVGIMLSTLHQSSLGSLFLIMPHRLHPLWYTPILPVLFFVSAIGLGLMMVTVESIVSAWLYEQPPEKHLLQGLGKAGAVVLALYAALKLGDVAVRGQLPAVFAGNYESWLFIIELSLSAIIPAVLLALPQTRRKMAGVATAAFVGVAGLVFNRITVGGLAMVGTTGTRYVPSWMEIIISVGIVAGAALVYLFVAERFHLFHAGPQRTKDLKNQRPGFNASTGAAHPDPFHAGLARYSLMGVLGAALVLAALPETALAGFPRQSSPVTPPGFGDLLVIDGNRADEAVAFPHQEHVDREGGEQSCASCHHLVLPGQENTGCARCHRDMYQETNIFNHEFHVERLETAEGCQACHGEERPLMMENTTACLDCHEGMEPEGATIELEQAPRLGLAANYTDAMHGLCVTCHQERATQPEINRPELGQCAGCHSDDVAAFDPLHPDERRQP
jgi:Ni/Fe-hydrogenase subunit HybB-like protein